MAEEKEEKKEEAPLKKPKIQAVLEFHPQYCTRGAVTFRQRDPFRRRVSWGVQFTDEVGIACCTGLIDDAAGICDPIFRYEAIVERNNSVAIIGIGWVMPSAGARMMPGLRAYEDPSQKLTYALEPSSFRAWKKEHYLPRLSDSIAKNEALRFGIELDPTEVHIVCKIGVEMPESIKCTVPSGLQIPEADRLKLKAKGTVRIGFEFDTANKTIQIAWNGILLGAVFSGVPPVNPAVWVRDNDIISEDVIRHVRIKEGEYKLPPAAG